MYNLLEGMLQSSAWETIMKRVCHVFSPVATTMHAVVQIHSTPKATNETLQEYIQRSTDFVIPATGTHPLLLHAKSLIPYLLSIYLIKKLKNRLWEQR